MYQNEIAIILRAGAVVWTDAEDTHARIRYPTGRRT